MPALLLPDNFLSFQTLQEGAWRLDTKAVKLRPTPPAKMP